MKTLLIITAILLAGTASAETFKCQAGTYWSNSGDTVVTATGNDDATGEIKVAGVTYSAWFLVEGFDRKWRFGADGISEDHTYDYLFVINPSGQAAYYDFTNSEKGDFADPKQVFVCKEIK